MDELLRESIALWHQCPETAPLSGRTFSEEDQIAREARLERFLLVIQSEVRSLPRNRAERQASLDRITAAFTEFGEAALGLEARHFDVMLGGGLSSIGSRLARQARRFDPSVSTADIFQANRNAWTACGLQMLLGQTMRLTPSIFAYSMLYPYTDNYLDDPSVPREEKLGFGARFGQRLAGGAVAPANGREALIWGLVDLIEGQYPREAWPQVFESLLAIHQAQQKSIRLLRRNGAPEGVDVLALVFEKGGVSVLADGYLAAGTLAPEEARFIFHWGVLLQLADDLQDVKQDRQDGVLTLFSQAAEREPLDSVTNRTIQFARRVLRLIEDLPKHDCSALKELIRDSSLSLLIRSAGDAGELYSRSYLDALETHSPFRFSYLNGRRRQLTPSSSVLARLFEAFLDGDEDEPAFPLLPGSLMPRV
jgi:hypothetical protein